MLRRKVPRISGLELKAAEATQSHIQAKVEGRRQNAEMAGIAAQSHHNATSKPPQSLLIANRLRTQSHPKATPRPPSSQLIRPLQNLGGAETTCFLRVFGIMRIAVLRPSVVVLRSLAPGRLARYASVEAYGRANARLFRNQQALDWAIVQSEVLARLRELSLPVPAKVITFRRRPAVVAACQACVPGERGWRANSCRMESFYSLHRRGFVARSSGRRGEKCDFRRPSFACTGLFELGSVSKPSTSR